MKQLTLFFAISSSLLTGFAQNVKTKNWSMRYEYLPEKVPAIKYETYKVFPVNAATDNVPLDGRFIFYAEDYIKGLKNITVPEVKGGILVGGIVVGGTKEKQQVTESDLSITVKFNNIEILEKKDIAGNETNPTTNAVQKIYSFSLCFKFPYQLIVQDLKNKTILIDTIVSSPKYTKFPGDYKYNAYGDKVPHKGYFVKSDLDLDYNQNSANLYTLSKKTLAKNCMDEVKSIVNSKYGYNSESIPVHFYWVKSKNKLFDVCDSTTDLMRSIVDTVELHEKYNKHINWHCPSVKSNAQKLIRIWESMLNDPKYTGEFSDPKDLLEYTTKIKRNLMLAYMFNDNFAEANKYANEVKSNMKVFTGNSYAPAEPSFVLLKTVLDREEKLFPAHKDFFGFK